MKARKHFLLPLVCPLFVSLGLSACAGAKTKYIPTLSSSTLPVIAQVEERFQSYNVEMAEVIGGNFWKPYDAKGRVASTTLHANTPTSTVPGLPQIGQNPSMFQKRAPIDLSNERLRKLALALGPAYVRVSGTWANSVYFDDSEGAALKSPPKGFQGVLTRSEWKGVIDFSRAVDARLVTSFTISSGVRDASGVWTPGEARKLMNATHSLGGAIAAAEFFNEPTFALIGGAPAGYSAADYVRDFAIFRRFAQKAAPEMKIVGPGSVGEGIPLTPPSIPLLKTVDLLSAKPHPNFDIFSYHFYGAASLRCAALGTASQTHPEDALSEKWLSRTDRVYAFYAALRDRFEPGRPIWITETADAACGGNPWATTFLDSFRYLDQLGRLARHGVQAVFHNTLASSEYGLLDQDTFAPRPNYWAALLWRKLMGRIVLDAGNPSAGHHFYAHCIPGSPGGVSLLAINTSPTERLKVEVSEPAKAYLLTADHLMDSSVQLNQRKLELSPNGELPSLEGKAIPAGELSLPPASIAFLAFESARNQNCK